MPNVRPRLKIAMTNIEKPIEIGLQRVGNWWGGLPMKQRGVPSTFIAADFRMSFLGLKILSVLCFFNSHKKMKLKKYLGNSGEIKGSQNQKKSATVGRLKLQYGSLWPWRLIKVKKSY